MSRLMCHRCRDSRHWSGREGSPRQTANLHLTQRYLTRPHTISRRRKRFAVPWLADLELGIILVRPRLPFQSSAQLGYRPPRIDEEMMFALEECQR